MFPVASNLQLDEITKDLPKNNASLIDMESASSFDGKINISAFSKSSLLLKDHLFDLLPQYNPWVIKLILLKNHYDIFSFGPTNINSFFNFIFLNNLIILRSSNIPFYLLIFQK